MSIPGSLSQVTSRFPGGRVRIRTHRLGGIRTFTLSVALSACVVFGAAGRCLAQATGKTVVKSEADLPRFNYALTGSATELLQSDDATFGSFAAKVRADVDSVLTSYDIEDHATLRDLLGVRLDLQLLSGDDRGATATVARLRQLQDKPDAKLMTGLVTTAMIEAERNTGKASGPDYVKAFEKAYAAEIEPLPWSVVGNAVREARTTDVFRTPAIVLGGVKANLDPALARTHRLSNVLAWRLVGDRIQLRRTIPLHPAMLAVLNQEIAANNARKPDIWAARDVTLTRADHLTPVNVGIWDSGTDLSLFPGRVYTVPHPGPKADAHDIAFDLKGFPTHGYVFPLTAAQRKEYPTVLSDIKGLSDLQLSLDSPETRALRQELAHMRASEVPSYFERLRMFTFYAHGTHVAGIAARGNPAVRLAVARLTFNWHNMPLRPSEASVERDAKDFHAAVDWFRANHVRVVNMSWGGTPRRIEVALEKNGMGKDAAERKAIAARLFAVMRKGLYEALKSASDVLFVCSAGNSNSNISFDEQIPSSFELPNLLTVGAVDQAGEEASFTSYGPTVRVDADGYEVLSVVPGGGKLRLSGTSMASPNVVNLAAKLIALDPKLTPEQTIHLIVAGATTSPDGRRHNIDPKRSVELLRQMRGGTGTSGR